MSSLLDDSDLVLGEYPEVDKRTCMLLGPTALVVQALMGVLVVLSLVYKRYREKPRRAWRIWIFDVSKQIAGQVFVHVLNLFISDVGAHESSGNPCVLYFLNILIDTTLGVAIIYLVLRITTNALTENFQLKSLRSGQYGDPPSLIYWAHQTAVYIFALTTMKLTVVGLFAVWPGIVKVGAWLMSWTGGDDAVQVIFVMGIFPIAMNILQFWLIDSIVKASASHTDAQLVLATSPRHSADVEPLCNNGSDDEADDSLNTAPVDVESRPVVHNVRSSPRHSRVSLGSVDEEEDKRMSSSTSARALDDVLDEIQTAHAYPPPPSISPVSSLQSSSDFRNLSNSLSRKRSPPPCLAHSPSHSLPITSPQPLVAPKGTFYESSLHKTDSPLTSQTAVAREKPLPSIQDIQVGELE